MFLSQVIRLKRKCLDMSLDDFSKICNVSSTTIANLEKGRELSKEKFSQIMTNLKNYESSLCDEDKVAYYLRYSVELLINEPDERMIEKNCDEVIFKAIRLKNLKYEG